MGIVDPKYGSEIITGKGRVYKFDDVTCLNNFIKSGALEEKDIKQTVVINFEKQNDFLDIHTAFFVLSANLRSPMGGNAAAFFSREAAARFSESNKGEVLNWAQLTGKMQ
jgi:copper chaperone NosL